MPYTKRFHFSIPLTVNPLFKRHRFEIGVNKIIVFVRESNAIVQQVLEHYSVLVVYGKEKDIAVFQYSVHDIVVGFQPVVCRIFITVVFK